MNYEKKFKALLEKYQRLEQQLEGLLIDSDKKLPSYLENNNEMFVIIELIFDTNNQAVDFYFRKVNSTFQKIIALPIEEIIDHKVNDIFVIVENYWFETFARVLKTGKSQSFQNYSKELQKYFEIYSWKVNEQEIAIIFNEIPENTKKLTQLKETKAKVVALNISKDRLLTVIAHDLRSPFNVILGYSNLLIENATANRNLEETLKYSIILHTKAKESLVMLDNILEWGNTQNEYVNFKIEKIKINILIEEMIQILHPSASIKKISLVFNASDPIAVLADRNMLKSIFVNLISNAIKFTNSNGEIQISSNIQNDFCEVRISDNGVGIDPKKQAELFKSKKNTSSIGTAGESGSGLGLLICKEFVQMNHGEIKSESKIGKGSSFIFTLPLSL